MHNSDDETFFCVGIFIIHFRPTSQGGQGRKEGGAICPKEKGGERPLSAAVGGGKREEKVDIVWDMGRMGGGGRKGVKEERAFPGPPPYFLYYYYFLHHRTSSFFPFTLSLSPATHALKSHKRMWRRGEGDRRDGSGYEIRLHLRPCPFGIRCQHTRSEGECYIFVPSFPPKKHCRLLSSFK